MTEAANHRATIAAYLSAVSDGATGDRLAAFFHPEIIQDEFPNRLLPKGAQRDLAAILEAARKGRSLMRNQTLQLHRVLVEGDTACAEVTWTGVLGVPLGKLAPGDPMRARFAIVVEFRDGLIWRQRNYDCFDPS